jgi:hypothetical protein
MKGKTIKRSYERISEYYGYNDYINLSTFETNEPCPICNTVLDDLIDVPIYKHFKKRKSNGEKNPFVCSICVQKLIKY